MKHVVNPAPGLLDPLERRAAAGIAAGSDRLSVSTTISSPPPDTWAASRSQGCAAAVSWAPTGQQRKARHTSRHLWQNSVGTTHCGPTLCKAAQRRDADNHYREFGPQTGHNYSQMPSIVVFQSTLNLRIECEFDRKGNLELDTEGTRQWWIDHGTPHNVNFIGRIPLGDRLYREGVRGLIRREDERGKSLDTDKHTARFRLYVQSVCHEDTHGTPHELAESHAITTGQNQTFFISITCMVY